MSKIFIILEYKNVRNFTNLNTVNLIIIIYVDIVKIFMYIMIRFFARNIFSALYFFSRHLHAKIYAGIQVFFMLLFFIYTLT